MRFAQFDNCNMTSAKRRQPPVAKKPAGTVAKGRRSLADTDMFDSYARLDIHDAMMQDFPRTDAYRRAILAGRAHFEGKVVLDVGCGLGILSMFAARLGGARVVYAVEASNKTAARARTVIERNGLSETIRVLVGQVEAIRLPEKVDVIISEWMGYFLVHESMLESVLRARDRWLKPGGLMYPCRARLFAGPGNFQKQIDEKAGTWKPDLFGFDFGPIREEAEAEVKLQPLASSSFVAEQLMPGVDPAIVADFNLATCTTAAVRRMRADFAFRMPKGSPAQVVHGLALWFDVLFPSGVKLPTGPCDLGTHWGQTLTFFDEALVLAPGEQFDGTLRLSANATNHRFYDLSIEAQSLGCGAGMDGAEVAGNDDNGWPFPVQFTDDRSVVTSRPIADGEVLLRVDPLVLIASSKPCGVDHLDPLGALLRAAVGQLTPRAGKRRRADVEVDEGEDDEEDVVRDSWADLGELRGLIPVKRGADARDGELVQAALRGLPPASRRSWPSSPARKLLRQLRAGALRLPAASGGGLGLYPSLLGFRWCSSSRAPGANCVLRASRSRPGRLVVLAKVKRGRRLLTGERLVLRVATALGTGVAHAAFPPT